MMKKLGCILLFISFTLMIHAQLNWGVKAGFNASTLRGLGELYEESADIRYQPGFHAGLMLQYHFHPQIGIETGLYGTMLGNHVENDNFNDTEHPFYLQVPVSLFYKFNVGQDLCLYPSVGLYAGYGIAGKSKAITNNTNGKASITTDFFNEARNRFDAGATLGLNLQYSQFIIGLGYDYGFTNVLKDDVLKFTDRNGEDLKTPKLYNGSIKISLGYLF